MYTVKENATMVGVSELRDGLEKVLEKSGKNLVVIEKRHKPIAVMMSNDEYEQLVSMVDMAEDIVLGHIAEQRFKSAEEKDYLDIESLL